MLTAAKQRRMGNTPSQAIALAAIFAVGVKSQEFCSCSPTQFEFQLTLNQNCDTNGMFCGVVSVLTLVHDSSR
jgi:hypothetical protein